ncbi:unnamed protein product, partial [Darwinula stevensoni]
VSWIRKKDLHVLTSGIFVYTSDPRFRMFHAEGSGDWTLEIVNASARDAGTYECQINTEPKKSLTYRLNVARGTGSPATAVGILGPRDLYVKESETVNVTCAIHHADSREHSGSDVRWKKDDQTLLLLTSPDSSSPPSMLVESRDRTSSLLILDAKPQDSGLYSCSLPLHESSSPASSSSTVQLHVIQGENSAAMQREHPSTHASNDSTSRHLSSLFFSLLVFFGCHQ